MANEIILAENEKNMSDNVLNRVKELQKENNLQCGGVDQHGALARAGGIPKARRDLEDRGRAVGDAARGHRARVGRRIPQ